MARQHRNSPLTIAAIVALISVLGSSAKCQTRPTTTEILTTVVDAGTRKPIPDAKVAFGYDYVFKELKANRLGQAVITVDAGHTLSFWARVNAPDHVGQIVKWTAPGGDRGNGQGSLTVALDAGHLLGGTVVDVDGHAVAGAYIGFRAVNSPTQTPQIFYDASVITDKSGHWSATVFPDDASKLSFMVRKSGYADFDSNPQPIDASLKNQTSVLTVHFPLSIDFSVTDSQTGERVKDRKAFRVVSITKPDVDEATNSLGIGIGNGDFSMNFDSAVQQGAIRIEADGFESVTSPQVTRDVQRTPLSFNAILKRAKDKPRLNAASSVSKTRED